MAPLIFMVVGVVAAAALLVGLMAFLRWREESHPH
jgi:hypothetical protein